VVPEFTSAGAAASAGAAPNAPSSVLIRLPLLLKGDVWALRITGGVKVPKVPKECVGVVREEGRRWVWVWAARNPAKYIDRSWYCFRSSWDILERSRWALGMTDPAVRGG